MIVLSPSKITCYLGCPRRYWCRYVRKMTPSHKAAALAFGSAVHSALETFHLQRAAGASMTPDAVAALFRIDWASEQVDEIRFKEDETAEDLAVTGEALVKLYVAANQNVAVEAAEVPFELPIIAGIVLRGVFDVLIEGGRVREMKTAARDFDAGTLARHVQVSAYCWAYKALRGHLPVVEIVALLKQKHPRLASHDVTRSEADLSWFVGMAVEVARAIEAGVYPPNPSWACNDCEYGEQCRLIGGRP